MTKVTGKLVMAVGIALSVIGLAAAAIQLQARATQASDEVARKLDTVASLLMDAEGNPRADHDVAGAARGLLAIQTVLAGQELINMSEDARDRTLTIVQQVHAEEELSLINDDGVKNWAAKTRECMLSKTGSRRCGIELPPEVNSQ